jgi:MaoC like domain
MSNRRASDLRVGQTFETVVVEDLKRAQIVQYAGASGDHNPLHTDEIYATKVAGYPRGVLGVDRESRRQAGPLGTPVRPARRVTATERDAGTGPEVRRRAPAPGAGATGVRAAAPGR